jgi:hypothetical protein
LLDGDAEGGGGGGGGEGIDFDCWFTSPFDFPCKIDGRGGAAAGVDWTPVGDLLVDGVGALDLPANENDADDFKALRAPSVFTDGDSLGGGMEDIVRIVMLSTAEDLTALNKSPSLSTTSIASPAESSPIIAEYYNYKEMQSYDRF